MCFQYEISDDGKSDELLVDEVVEQSTEFVIACADGKFFFFICT